VLTTPHRKKKHIKLRNIHTESLGPGLITLVRPQATEQAWGKWETYTEFWWGSTNERHHLEDPAVNGRIILRCIFRKWDVGACTESRWFRI